MILCKYDPVLRWSRDCDNTLYQALVEILIPDVLRPIPSEFLPVKESFTTSTFSSSKLLFLLFKLPSSFSSSPPPQVP